MIPFWLNYFEAADRVGVTVETIREWVARGEITPVRNKLREQDVTAHAHRLRQRGELIETRVDHNTPEPEWTELT